jgi:hypothetical protein
MNYIIINKINYNFIMEYTHNLKIILLDNNSIVEDNIILNEIKNIKFYISRIINDKIIDKNSTGEIK